MSIGGAIPADDPIVQSLIFNERGVEVSYIERRHIGTNGTRVQTILVNGNFYQEQITELITSVRELIDQYDVDEKNPPQRLPNR